MTYHYTNYTNYTTSKIPTASSQFNDKMCKTQPPLTDCLLWLVLILVLSSQVRWLCLLVPYIAQYWLWRFRWRWNSERRTNKEEDTGNMLKNKKVFCHILKGWRSSWNCHMIQRRQLNIKHCMIFKNNSFSEETCKIKYTKNKHKFCA